MNGEQKTKIFLALLALVFSILSYFNYFYSNVALLLVTAIVAVEIHLRIQHNIDSILESNRKISENQHNVEIYVDNFKKEITIFFGKVLRELEIEKQKMDDNFMLKKGDLDKDMEHALDGLDLWKKETGHKLDRTAERVENLTVLLKVFLESQKLDSKRNFPTERLLYLEKRVQEFDNKINYNGKQ